MSTDYINLTCENLENEHLCCIIRTRKPHQGIEAKRLWLSERLKEGHVFRKFNAKGCAFIEYAPLEKAWVPIIGDNYCYIYCLWAVGDLKGHGYGRELMEYCINDAKNKNKSGICLLGAEKQKAWLTDMNFAKSFGFKLSDTTNNGYQLLALSFDDTVPHFAPNAKSEKIESRDLTVFYDMQCPYILQRIDMIKEYCDKNAVPVNLVLVDSLQAAKALPCVFNNFALFYGGEFQTVNLPDIPAIERIIKKYQK